MKLILIVALSLLVFSVSADHFHFSKYIDQLMKRSWKQIFCRTDRIRSNLSGCRVSIFDITLPNRESSRVRARLRRSNLL